MPMYDKEAGVIACDSCDITIEGYGRSGQRPALY